MEKDLLDNPYILLTPGPLSTSRTVRQAMFRDWCTWDDDYNLGVVQVIRKRLVELATTPEHQANYTSVLMQGSGTFSVESVIGSVLPENGKLLVLANGVYGQRLAKIAKVLKIDHVVHDSTELNPIDLDRLRQELANTQNITHVVVVHGETTTGMLNPIREVGQIAKEFGKTYIVDAMSTFGGISIDVHDLQIDFIISSANKCVQGVPGFGFVVAKTSELQAAAGRARSLSLDLFDQWKTMEDSHGKWRFTSPTHTVRAFSQALTELDEEGGIEARHQRYSLNQKTLVAGMKELGFECLLPEEWHSPIITSFFSPTSPEYNFRKFYDGLKERGFVIYPGKVTDRDTFRIGSIGEVYKEDVDRLLVAIAESKFW